MAAKLVLQLQPPVSQHRIVELPTSNAIIVKLHH